jgi:hypothetical protein
VIGSFPTANCRNLEQLDAWLSDMVARLRRRADETGNACAPICPNLIVHRSNPRLAGDLRIVLKHAPVRGLRASDGISRQSVAGPVPDELPTMTAYSENRCS